MTRQEHKRGCNANKPRIRNKRSVPLSTPPFELLLQSDPYRYFDHFVGVYSHIIHGYLRSLVKSPEEAEELTQATFIHTYINLSKYRPTGSFVAWVKTIAYHLFITQWGVLKMELHHLSVYAARMPTNTIPAPSSNEVTEDVLAPLSPLERDIIIKFYKDGMSRTEIALIHKKTKGTVSNILARARTKIRNTHIRKQTHD